ncbi:hypothetical protein NDI56_20210 [Haloarcula sp. S1CR25-12]|uniref:NERD domain-containing protein n=1 Tax=Haloarcula saliterrae TaxID=2950534 RepID=A0ABU2FHK1_9EURY|nr:hypothetical protein [Haloarcula sp. S1CR25-12]MDS0261731.1 hypothetical protein [Haloarcula sp. S1CR25-12]
MSSDIFRKNLRYISSLGRYNTERRPVIRQYFANRISNSEFNQEKLNVAEIREFAGQKQSRAEDTNLDFEERFKESLLTLPEDINPQDFQGYLLFRYSHLEEPLSNQDEFAISDLLSFEALIRDTILEESEPILSDLNRFKSKEDYADFSNIEEPSKQFQQMWNRRVTLSRKEIIKSFVEGTLPDDPTIDPSRHQERIEKAQDILDFLSYSGDDSSLDFFSNPVFQVKGVKEREIVVPFPEVLLTTAQYRIEEFVGQFKQVQEVENKEKGGVVEELAQELLQQIPCRNFVKEFEYIHDPNPGEADGLLFFEDSYWVVEIKSHPIFRKIPNRVEIIKNRFTQKVTQAVDQIENALDYVDGLDDEFGLVYNLTGNKNSDEIDTGGIVILDGFLPTLYSGNARADQQLGMGDIHDHIAEHERIVVITLYDLYQLIQEDEANLFDEFLIWRTGYEGNMPVWGFSEREYWAFYFDNYRTSEEFRKGVEEAAKKDIITIYISERFNDKSHLQNIKK